MIMILSMINDYQYNHYNPNVCSLKIVLEKVVENIAQQRKALLFAEEEVKSNQKGDLSVRMTPKLKFWS